MSSRVCMWSVWQRGFNHWFYGESTRTTRNVFGTFRASL